MTICDQSHEEAVEQYAGNWKRFDCFIWDRLEELDDADNWAIIYTHHRDSGLLDLSNASVIDREMTPFTEADDPDVIFESHNHWAVGHVDGFSIRVIRHGQITEAFKVYLELQERMDTYPILDEDDYSERETEATFANLEDAARRLKDEYDLPEGWEDKVYCWLSDNNPSAIENRDDQGGYPDENELREAFDDLQFVATP
ncbi:hypothetical protein Pla110_45450 [Polystyrenella longa]|uniref:Uncharacterized protein n=1 Tax=Polystyrenella longa TaxID=2528007 RepID=A0A518CU75_9PLAN|nr:hypothetical protein [Polystyrenella longa]QDU82783.1 hypothetical protein Pla110_45450 [Polystyrenella longa]